MPQPKPSSSSSKVKSPVYKRVLLKISGEGFSHEGGFGIEADEIENIAKQCVEVCKSGVELAIVVGGGNFIRGATFAEDGHIKRATADYMGMLATVMNGLALQDTLEAMEVPTRLMSAVRMETVAEPYIRRRAIRHLEKGRVVILAAGTGNPFVTTDTAAALRGTELEVAVVLKATRVDGVYSADPGKDPNATKYDSLTYDKVIKDRLRVMDIGAFEMCRLAKLPILVFNYKRDGAIEKAIAGQRIGTIVSQ